MFTVFTATFGAEREVKLMNGALTLAHLTSYSVFGFMGARICSHYLGKLSRYN